MDTTFETVSSRRLRDELNGCGLAFLYFEAILAGRKNKAAVSRSIASLWVRADSETVRMVRRCDLELDLRALFDSDGGGIEVIFLGRNFDDLDIPICGGRLRSGNSAACQKESRKQKKREQQEMFHGSLNYGK
jgi:hypothetical protein